MAAPEIAAMRRVVTGVDEDGRSCVLFDGPPTMRLSDTHAQLWTTTGVPVDNRGFADAALTEMALTAPGAGTKFLLGTYPAGFGVDAATHAGIADAIRAMGGLVGDDPALHRTSTIDYVVVLDGELVMLLDDGEVTLGRFDCVVQRGTSHGWMNRGPQDALLAIFMVEAAPETL
jgi:hypothetical protein